MPPVGDHERAVTGERVEQAVKRRPELLKRGRRLGTGEQSDQRVEPASDRFRESGVQQLLHRAEVVADRAETHARAVGDIPRRRRGVPLLLQRRDR
jgi:hypothetical protein